MSNKKTKRKLKKSSPSIKSKLTKIFLLIFLFALIASTLSYFIIKDKDVNKSINTIIKSQNQELNQLKEEQTKKLDIYFDEIKEKFEEETEELKKDFIQKKEITKPVVKIEKKELEKVEKKEIPKVIPKNNKPKIAIIIDDVSNNRQKKAILDIGYNVTMAFLPPQEGHSNSAKIAQNLAVYMIHLPMQASAKFKSTEKITLNITDSYEKIETRIKNLRKLYPNAKYTNNHTGSVFTSNDKAMDRLFRALKKYNFIFVDSRTTAKSVAKKYAKIYNMPYIVRNTFLDNEKNYTYIQNQLKKAIKIAKKRGYAIAIGHPHSMTIKVLKESSYLFKDVEPIFINKLPFL